MDPEAVTDFLTYVSENPLLGVIAAGEIAFWVVLVAGLATRYLLRLPRVSRVILLCVPLVDLVILTAALADLVRGSVPDLTHGLASTYLGFTVAFGHSMIRWADQRFAHRFAGGPPPVKPPKYGAAKVRYEWREWGKFVVAWAISCGLLLVMMLLSDAPESDRVLWGWIARLSVVGAIWFIFWPLWTTLSPPRDPDGKQHSEQHRERTGAVKERNR